MGLGGGVRSIHRLPFSVGQEAEAKSFDLGFRGAWFRCKILEIASRRGQLSCYVEYYDFPDEKLTWLRMYQKFPHRTLASSKNALHLMLRPQFPPYQFEHVDHVAGLTAVVNDAWKVGDLVDWWYEGCFWSGKIIKLHDDAKAQVELTRPPYGEGESYCAEIKDLRPSLDWSLESGWTVPISQENGKQWYACRLIDTSVPDEPCVVTEVDGHFGEDGRLVDSVMEEDSLGCRAEGTPPPDNEKEQASTSSRSDRSRYARSASTEKATVHKFWSRHHPPDTINECIIELEELVNKVKWLKDSLLGRIEHLSTAKPSWRIIEEDGKCPPTQKSPT